MRARSPSFTFRTKVHHVQMPAKHAVGRLSSKADHTGARPQSDAKAADRHREESRRRTLEITVNASVSLSASGDPSFSAPPVSSLQ
jgi:hypothetical protein